MQHTPDVVIVGAGAAGLMCAATAARRGRRVVLLEHARRPGRKILMSGGGRCNFTHLHSTPEHFLSDNPRFCISALSRYTPWHFLELVDAHRIEYVEKAPGQLFCRGRSREILDMLCDECDRAGVETRLKTSVLSVERRGQSFVLETDSSELHCESLVVATGGLSIPSMGATGFGYRLAEQFGLKILPTRAGLVPFTLEPELKSRLAPLAGVSTEVEVSCDTGMRFREPMLITHRGLSGPSMLQISSYWHPGETLSIDLLPETDAGRELPDFRAARPQSAITGWLDQYLPSRLGRALAELHHWSGPLQGYSRRQLEEAVEQLEAWRVRPAGTEGYRTAEVTLGGVDTRALSSRSMMVRDLPGLFFIGEVVDVTGHLGGHNFQWAWASAVAAGQYT